ncbi:MAG: ice-binding family protein [Minisyncoccia bacterium]
MKKFNKISILVLVIVFALGTAGLIKARAASTVSLGTADNFAVLAGSGITDTTPSVVSGDVGLSPTTGAAIGITVGEVTGTVYAVDVAGPVGSVNNPGLLTLAKDALTTAYGVAAGQAQTSAIVADLGGQTLTPGVYNSGSSIGLTGTVTLDGGGDANAVFIFQAGSTLTTASASHVNLINSAQACNVFWQVGSSATLGTTSDFKGNILAFSSITDNGGSTVDGRLLARNAAVTLNNTHVTKSTCSTPVPTPTPTPTPTPVAPLISIEKVPSLLSLSVGGGLISFDYTVLNVGTVAMSNVTVTDNKCSPVAFISGDTNSDSKLDLTETWKYNCTSTVTQTTTNTATATGQANGFTATDTADATVVVGAALPSPLIHLIKKPSVDTLPSSGGAVTYTYTVTNPGTVALSNVSVVDDKCSSVSSHSGDTNNNNLLDISETWTYTCQSNLTQTTTNKGTAEGSGNGLTAIDYSLATVTVAGSVVAPVVVSTPVVKASTTTTSVVTTPKLPNTGFAPEEKSNVWNIIIPAGIFITLFSFYLAKKKQII